MFFIQILFILNTNVTHNHTLFKSRPLNLTPFSVVENV